MRVLFLTKYSPLGSSSRYRVYQFLPYYEAAGLDCFVANFHTDGYVRQFIGMRDWRPKARRLPYLVSRYLRRLRCCLQAGRYDLIVVEQEVFPLLPVVFDSLLFRVAEDVVVEYDDATHIYHQRLLDSPLLRSLLSSKVPTLMARSAGVVVGNQYLAAYAQQHNPNVLLAPTAIDTGRYRVKRAEGFSPPGSACIGWIGTPLTVSYLDEIADALRSLAVRYDITLKVIGAPAFQIAGVPVVAIPWRLETEVEELLSCDIGVMPLTDDDYSRGKCGAKLLQYMSVGIPAVASPVGVNQEIIEQGRNGFLAQTTKEWVEGLEQLITDVNLRRKLGSAAREKVERDYALSTISARLIEFFRGFG
ncbi:MAG: glycosyltransferase family 4 protein [Chloroflexota bacterium]|nr:glycosyltransferase family 4 protein [Chloroflexota bacterium]